LFELGVRKQICKFMSRENRRNVYEDEWWILGKVFPLKYSSNFHEAKCEEYQTWKIAATADEKLLKLNLI
jgi:hypothetical protein